MAGHALLSTLLEAQRPSSDMDFRPPDFLWRSIQAQKKKGMVTMHEVYALTFFLTKISSGK
jgi:hypothetical protein